MMRVAVLQRESKKYVNTTDVISALLTINIKIHYVK